MTVKQLKEILENFSDDAGIQYGVNRKSDDNINIDSADKVVSYSEDNETNYENLIFR